MIMMRQVFKLESKILSSLNPLKLSVNNFHQHPVIRECEYKLLCFLKDRILNKYTRTPIYWRKNRFSCLPTVIKSETVSGNGPKRSFSTDARMCCPSRQTESGAREESGVPQDEDQSASEKGDLVSTENQDKAVGQPTPEYKCIYYFPPINVIRIVQKFQLLLYSTLLPASSVFICTVPEPSYLMISFVVTNVLLMPAVFYIMPRIIGSIFVGGAGDVVDTLKVSRLSFFGNRKNIVYKIENVKPLSEVGHANTVFSKFELYNKKDKFYLFHSYAKILDRELYEIIFGKIKE